MFYTMLFKDAFDFDSFSLFFSSGSNPATGDPQIQNSTCILTWDCINDNGENRRHEI